MQAPTSKPGRRVLITGAAGRAGSALRPRLAGKFDLLRLADVADLGRAGPGEEIVQCDLTDRQAVIALCQGVDAIVHLAAYPRETRWDHIIASNVEGTTNLYEGARKAGVDRVLFASSISVVGFYRAEDTVDHLSPPRPDSRYAVSKVFGESMAMMYAYKYGIRAFVMRLGACRQEPGESSLLPIWLSYDDLARLVIVGLEADYTHEVVYGVSRTSEGWWDNRNAFRLGYEPKDDADDFRDSVKISEPASDVDAAFKGAFAFLGYSGNIDWVP